MPNLGRQARFLALGLIAFTGAASAGAVEIAASASPAAKAVTANPGSLPSARPRVRRRRDEHDGLRIELRGGLDRLDRDGVGARESRFPTRIGSTRRRRRLRPARSTTSS